MEVHKIQLNFDSRGPLVTKNKIILRIEEVRLRIASAYPLKLTNRCQEDFLHYNQYGIDRIECH